MSDYKSFDDICNHACRIAKECALTNATPTKVRNSITLVDTIMDYTCKNRDLLIERWFKLDYPIQEKRLAAGTAEDYLQYLLEHLHNEPGNTPETFKEWKKSSGLTGTFYSN